MSPVLALCVTLATSSTPFIKNVEFCNWLTELIDRVSETEGAFVPVEEGDSHGEHGGCCWIPTFSLAQSSKERRQERRRPVWSGRCTARFFGLCTLRRQTAAAFLVYRRCSRLNSHLWIGLQLSNLKVTVHEIGAGLIVVRRITLYIIQPCIIQCLYLGIVLEVESERFSALQVWWIPDWSRLSGGGGKCTWMIADTFSAVNSAFCCLELRGW